MLISHITYFGAQMSYISVLTSHIANFGAHFAYLYPYPGAQLSVFLVLKTHLVQFSFQNIRLFVLYKNIYFVFHSNISCPQYKMKSKDLQQVVFRKYEDGDSPTKIFRHLNRSLR